MGKKKALRNHRRRAGTKTKLKNGNFSKYKPPQISNQAVKKTWNPNKSVQMNMSALGLEAQVNGEVAQRGNVPVPASGASAVELFDIPDSDVIPKKTKALSMLPVSVEDQKYMVKLMERYGDDWEKMARDIKRNNMQHSSHKLKKLGSRFLLLSEAQLRVELPESVKEMMASL